MPNCVFTQLLLLAHSVLYFSVLPSHVLGQQVARTCMMSITVLFIHSFIFILWIPTGSQNPYGYGNSQICLRDLEVKSL